MALQAAGPFHGTQLQNQLQLRHCRTFTERSAVLCINTKNMQNDCSSNLRFVASFVTAFKVLRYYVCTTGCLGGVVVRTLDLQL